MKIETSTELLPLLDVGINETVLDPDYVFEYHINELASKNLEETAFDYSKYKADVARIANAWIKGAFEEPLKKYGVLSIECTGIGSPREYNFRTDWGNLDVTVSDEFFDIMTDWLLLMESDKRIKTNKWLKEQYGSCDGFISLMPQSIQELIEHRDIERCVSVYLTIILLDEGLLALDKYYGIHNPEQEDFEHNVFERLSYEDYATLERKEQHEKKE